MNDPQSVHVMRKWDGGELVGRDKKRGVVMWEGRGCDEEGGVMWWIFVG